MLMTSLSHDATNVAMTVRLLMSGHQQRFTKEKYKITNDRIIFWWRKLEEEVIDPLSF